VESARLSPAIDPHPFGRRDVIFLRHGASLPRPPGPGR
jgi:hypothetical protein